MGSYVPNTSRRVLGFFFWGGKPLPRSCREFFFSKMFGFFNFSRPDFFSIFFWGGSFLHFKELIVAKNYNIFFPRLVAAPLSAETRRLSAEMKIPSAEMEKSRASALKARVTKRGRSRMMLTSILYDFCYDTNPKNYSNE